MKTLKDFNKILHTACTNWTEASKFPNLSEDIIREFQDQVDWGKISEYQKLSEPLIREFKDRVDWELISLYQKLSEPFIREFQDKVDWEYVSVLYLGYKELERGKAQTWKHLTNKELEGLFGDSFENIDTLFGQRYKDYLSKNFEYKYSYTRNEGEYSMYVDAVNKKVYMSSYNLEKPYEMKHPHKSDILVIFNQIRKDNGFEIYDENKGKKYWDE